MEKLQAQVRSLTRDVGALREALCVEEKKRERLAAHAKAGGDALEAAEAKVKQLFYVNTKLEQELRSLRGRADATAAKSRGGLEALRGRLAEVERSVHQRAVEGQRQLQRLHSQVQGVRAAAMPLAVAAASAAVAAGGPGASAAAAHALKSPLPGSSAGRAAQQRASSQPEQLHRQFAQLFGSLSALSELFAGGPGSTPAEGSAVSNPAPLLLTAPDGSTKAVHWADQNRAANPAAPIGSGSSSGGMSRHSGPSAPGASAAAAAAAGIHEKQRLVAEVQHLRAALAEARRQAASSAASAEAATGPAAASVPNAQPGSSSGRVEAAMKQLDAVVPQYRAAAKALQGQVQVLTGKLALAARERGALQDEVCKWWSLAQKHEAAFAEAAAQLHTREAQSLAASTQVQSQADRLQGDVDAMRRRCSELAGRLQESQQALVQAQSALASKEKLAGAQQLTIRQLESTIGEQQADIRAALELVSRRPAGAETAGDVEEEQEAAEAAGSWQLGLGGAGSASNAVYYGSGGWEAAAAAPACDGGWGAGHGSEFGVGDSGTTGYLASLLDAATAAADAATAWAGGGYDCGSGEAAAGEGCWECLDYDLHSTNAAAPAESSASWHIPAVGAEHSGFAGLQRTSAPPSPAKPAAAAAAAAAAASPCRRQCPEAQRAQSKGPALPAAQSLQGGHPAPALAAVEADIAGLEDALRSALCDFQV